MHAIQLSISRLIGLPAAIRAAMMRLLRAIRDNDLLDFNKALLYHQGLWLHPGDPPIADTATRRHWHGRLAFWSPLFFLFVIFPATLIAHWGDVIVLIDVIAYSFTLAGYICRIGCVVLRGNQVRTLVANLEALCRRAHVPRDDAHARLRTLESAHTARRVRRMLTTLLTLVTALLVNVLTYIPEIRRKRVLFASAWLPYDWRKSPSYELTVAAWYVAWNVPCFAAFSVDFLLIAILYLLIGELRLLRIDIAHIAPVKDVDDDDVVVVVKKVAIVDVEDVEEVDDEQHIDLDAATQKQETALPTEMEMHEDMERRLEECASRFQECIRLIGEFQDSFQWVLSTQLVCNIVPAVFTVVWATTALDLEQKAGVLVGLAGMSWMQLLGYCHLCDQITEESELVRDAVYNCDWLRASDGFKRSMRIMMARANQRVEITVANFVPLTRETFLTMANSAYSYYIALKDVVTYLGSDV